MIRVASVLFFGSVLLSPAQMVNQPPQQLMTEVAAQLAARTSSLLPRRASVSLELQNLTSLPAPEWSSFRNLLQDELRRSGVVTAGTSPESRVRVTLSENARGMLFVAEVYTGDNRQVAMLPWALPPSPRVKSRVNITSKVTWTQPEPILDVLLVDSDSQMLVLSTSKITSYRIMGNNWAPLDTASLVLPRPLPRDPRGRLTIASDGFRAYVPGATCTGVLHPQLMLTCVAGNENWPGGEARWVADRNLLESDATRTTFYAVANGFYTTPDGHAQDRSGQPVAGSEGWGSDIAAIDDPCSASSTLIATSSSTAREEVGVYQVANGQATAASDALLLPGPVTALWPSEKQGQATLVIRNPQTGEYEASRLGLACSE
jgi:hypothetical protein